MTPEQRRLEIVKNNCLLLNPYNWELYEKMQRGVDGLMQQTKG